LPEDNWLNERRDEMKKTMRTAGGMMLLFAAASASAAETKQTELAVEVRERAEYLENFNDKYYGTAPKTGESSDSFLLSRVRIGLSRQLTEDFSGKISLQDSRALDWGFRDQDWANSEFGGIVSNPQDDPLELGETWLQYKNGGFAAQAGRQSISYGNSRVFGPGEWKNSGKWIWDAVKAGWKSDKNWVEAFYGKNMIHDPDVFSLDHRHAYVGSGLYGHVQAADCLAIEPLLSTKYNDRSLDYQEKDLLYYGARLLFELNGFTADSTYVQQTGTIISAKGVEADSDAQGFNFDFGYAFNPQWSVGTTFSYASGNDKSTADNERFDGVYGASDKYYGLIHLMVWSNLFDYGLTANYKPMKELDLRWEYHQLYADEISDTWLSYKSGLNASSDHYGNEFDFMATWTPNKTWKFMAGASVFLPGDAVAEAVASKQEFLTDDTAYSGFFQVTYKFSTLF
jgi:hypothetical protein